MNTLEHIAAGLESSAILAERRGEVRLLGGINWLLSAVEREASDAQEQIDDGLSADDALAQGLSAALCRCERPIPHVPSPDLVPRTPFWWQCARTFLMAYGLGALVFTTLF